MQCAENRAFDRELPLGQGRQYRLAGEASILQLCQSEIEQLRSGFSQHDIGRFQIAMHYALAMRFVERVGDLQRVAQQLLGIGSGPLAMRSARVSPSRYSITR